MSVVVGASVLLALVASLLVFLVINLIRRLISAFQSCVLLPSSLVFFPFEPHIV